MLKINLTTATNAQLAAQRQRIYTVTMALEDRYGCVFAADWREIIPATMHRRWLKLGEIFNEIEGEMWRRANAGL